MKIRIPKKIKIAAIICAAALLVSLASWLCLRSAANALPSQDAASRWQGEAEARFAQLSCFMPEGEALTRSGVESFRSALDNKLVAEAIEAEEGGALWIDAYSATGDKLSVSGEHGSSQIPVTGVGGDFFFFHPLLLLDGGYISEGDLMHDTVVLDWEAAWRLFGSSDVAGLNVGINGREYRIAGVVETEGDRFTKKLDDGGARIYMHFDALSSILGEPTIESYEIVAPNPVSGFASGVVSSTFPIGEGELIENSGRYGIGKLWKVLTGFSERTLRLSGVAYPYWENAARLSENSAALLLPFVFVPLLIPAGCVVGAVTAAGKRISRKISDRARRNSEFG